MSSPAVRAAGGVLWRGHPTQPEVAVVHRPRYDDWSLPKGKLEPGEPAVLGALREVQEETGFAATVGRRLVGTSYRVVSGGREVDKTVRWWAMRAGAGQFVPSEEVDELRWLAPQAALSLMTAGRDSGPVHDLLAHPLDLTLVVLVRHASAGSRYDWDGTDAERPLDRPGRQQAGELARVLAVHRPGRLVSAPPLRCRQTIAPLGQRLPLPVEPEPGLGEEANAGGLQDALRAARGLATGGQHVVACSQGGVIPRLVRALADGAGSALARSVRAVAEPEPRKGSTWTLGFDRAGCLAAADYDRAPAG